MLYFKIIFRTLFFYFFILIVYRVMGKREVGSLSIVDLIVSVLIAELVAISLENINQNIFVVIIPIMLITVCQMGVAFLSLKQKKIRNIFDGKPSLIISKGKLNIKEMFKQRYNLDDLLTQLRENNVKSIKEVDYAILETTGKLSVFRKNKKENIFPLPLIVEGSIEYDNLKLLDKDEKWLMDNIKVPVSDIFYGFYKDESIYIIKQSELN